MTAAERAARVAIALGLFALAGCTRYWAKPGGTALEFEAVRTRCETESFQRFPRVLQTVLVSEGYVMPLRTECRSGPRGQVCFTTGGGFVPPSYSTVDLNSQPRAGAYRSCLMTAGWQPARDKEEAEAIIRMAPPMAPSGGPKAPVR